MKSMITHTTVKKIYLVFGALILSVFLYLPLSGEIFELKVVKQLIEGTPPKESKARISTMIYPPQSNKRVYVNNKKPVVKNGGKIYSWVDEHGVKNFSQIPPSGVVNSIKQHKEIKHAPIYKNRSKAPSYACLQSKKQAEVDAMQGKMADEKFERELEQRKKLKARLETRKINLKVEYDEALFECSDRHWPNISATAKCREGVHKKYEELREQIEKQIIALYD